MTRHKYTPAEQSMLDRVNNLWSELEPLFMRVHELGELEAPDEDQKEEMQELNAFIAAVLRKLENKMLMNLVTFLAGNYIAVAVFAANITGALEEEES